MIHTTTATRPRRTRTGLAAIAAAVLMSATACAGTEEQQEAGGGDLKVIVPVQAALLDPTQGSIQSLGVMMLGLEPLLRMQRDGSLEPELATSVQQPDPTTYVYKIRTDVKFWDDTPLTAEDVVYSFNLHAGKGSKSINASLWASVSGVEATAENEVTVTLTEPDPQFPYSVAQTGIVSKAFYEANGGEVGTPAVLNMGTGPYEFTSFTPSAETVLEANPDYWGEAPAYDEITARTVGDDSTRLLGVQSGEFDGIFNIPLNQLDSYAGIDDLEQAEAADYSVYKFNFDTSKAPWDDIHLRRAVTMAINRPELVQGPLDDKATLAPTLVPADVLKTLVDAGEVDSAYEEMDSQLAFNLDAAKEEMAQSSVPDGVSVKLPVTASDPNLSAIAQTAAQMLKEIGVDVEIQEVDDNSYYNAVYFQHTTDGFTLDNFGASSPDPANIPLYALYSANALPEGSGVNIAQYDNREVDALLVDSQRLATDDPKRGELLLEALGTSTADAPYVPVAFPNVYAAGNSKLDLSDFSPFWWLTRWSEPAS